MRNGDVYAICPFLPTNASVPRNYVPSLEFFVAAKRELIERGVSSFIPSHHPSHLSQPTFEVQEQEELAIMNDNQLKFVNSLIKQINQIGSSESSSKHRHSSGKSQAHSPSQTHITLQPPRNSKYNLARQGPFLLQPAPPELGGMEDEPEATDIVYMEVGAHGDAKDEDSERLGVVVIVYQDGKVDLCLDTEKVEGRWDVGLVSHFISSHLLRLPV